jgi:transcriptional regulator with XRE-family HTH domain
MSQLGRPDHPLLLYLRKRKMSQVEFAKRVGVTANTVNRWIQGELVPQRRNMERLIEETGGEIRPDCFFPIRVVRAA